MKFFIINLLCLVFGIQSAHAKELLPNYYRTSYSIDSKLASTEAKFRFTTVNAFSPDVTIRISVNGVWRNVNPDDSYGFEVKVQPGEYVFQFYINEAYREIITTSIVIEPQYVLNYDLAFEFVEEEHITVKKPVIYCHSSSDLPIELTVKPESKFSFTYPQVSNGNWNGIVKSTGGIEIDGIAYTYLFWESEQNYSFKPEGNGFKVEKAEVIAFLNEKLTELGLNQQEQTDFITFWGPQLVANGTSFVQFSIDESCNQFATMNCSPTPDAIRRVYIQIATWDIQFEPFLQDVTFESFEKTGWYITEWGGFSFSLPNLTFNK